MHLKKTQVITIAGSVWFLIGIMLLIKGLSLVIYTAHLSGHKGGPLLSVLMYAFTGAIFPSVVVLILLGLTLGYFKGKWALAKAATRAVKRISPMKGRIQLFKLYRLHDYLLIVGMIAIGRLMHWISLPSDVHGLIDITIGSALVNGAMVYFQFAIKLREQHLEVE